MPLAAQDRSNSRPSDSSDRGGGGRTAHESHGSSGPSAPSYTPPPPSSSSSSSDSSGWRRSDSSGSHGSNASKPPRTAVPVDPGAPGTSGPNRQPPNRRNDGRGHSHHGGYGGYGGYYPGYGYYPYGSFWWNVFYGYPYYGYDWQYPRYGTRDYERDGDFGAIDLDVSPSRTQVFLDGQYIGTVDDFDGWPRYLWLEKGTYDLVLYLDGYKTDARQISVYPGLVIGIDDHMERGESIRPEDLATKTHDRRDARRRYESDRNEELDRHGDADDQEDNWKSRARRHRVIVEDDDASEDADGRDSDQSEEAEQSEAAGDSTVKVSVEPDDASVYLDGKFIGTGADLARMASGLPVEPGDHKLSVVRPGRKDETVSFKVKPGQRVELEVQLEEKGGD